MSSALIGCRLTLNVLARLPLSIDLDEFLLQAVEFMLDGAHLILCGEQSLDVSSNCTFLALKLFELSCAYLVDQLQQLRLPAWCSELTQLLLAVELNRQMAQVRRKIVCGPCYRKACLSAAMEGREHFTHVWQ